MKIIRNIFLVIIFGALVSFCLYIAPNYKKDENNGKTNLVINYTNVTSTMNGKTIIADDGEIYLSMSDIENYYDKYVYYDQQYKYIIAAKNNETACFDISNKTVDINGKKSNVSILMEDDMYYIPITKLQTLYNIEVKYKQETDTVVIESLDRELKTSKTNKNVNVRYKNTFLSKSLEKLNSDSKVAIVPNQNEKSEWLLIRTENGILGYVKNEDLTDPAIERATASEEAYENKKISLVWEYFSEVSSAPQKLQSEKYDGVNVVSPSFFYMDSSNVKQNVGDKGTEYIKWAKSNNYEVWAMVSNNNDSSEKMNAFSNWINDYKKRKSVINQIVDYVEEYDLDGINIDFENIYLKDKDSLSRFIIELKPQLKNVGATLSVDVTEPDGSDTWSQCFNRNVIGDVADYIVFMAYDQVGTSSKTPGPTAAYYWVEKNINKFINQEEVKASKIILGIPFYSVLWQNRDGNVKGSAIPQKNIKIPEDAEITWLKDSQQNYMEYTQNNTKYSMWIEDAQATSIKLNLIEQYNLAGAAFWEKGYEDESVWSIVKQKLLE